MAPGGLGSGRHLLCACSLPVAFLPLTSAESASQGTQPAGDPCACLNWKETYEEGRAFCAEAAEVMMMTTNTNNKLSWYEEARRDPASFGWLYDLCYSFFEQLDNSLCVNLQHHAWGMQGIIGATWCLVSRRCRDLKGGRPLDDQVTTVWDPSRERASLKVLRRDISWKVCTPGADRQLGDLPPEQLLALVDGLGPLNASHGVVTKSAYPRLMPAMGLWPQIQEDWTAGRLGALPRPLQEAIAQNRPIVVDDEASGFGSQKVIHGPSSIFHIDHMKHGTCPDRVFCHRQETMGRPAA